MRNSYLCLGFTHMFFLLRFTKVTQRMATARWNCVRVHKKNVYGYTVEVKRFFVLGSFVVDCQFYDADAPPSPRTNNLVNDCTSPTGHGTSRTSRSSPSLALALAGAGQAPPHW